MISLFGKGFIGGKFHEIYKDEVFIEDRESLISKHSDILYGRGTSSNYNVFEDASKDIRDNLLLLTDTFKNLTSNNNFNLLSSWFCSFPHGFYSITKLTQEMLLESYCKTFNINYRIIRLNNVIGGDSKASNKKNALEYLVNKLKNNENIEIYDGDNYRNYIHVEDCCRAIKLILDKGNFNELYEIGTESSYRIIDLVSYCRDKLKSKSSISIIETPSFHKQVQVKDYFANVDKLYSFGFKPKYNIYETLDIICNSI